MDADLSQRSWLKFFTEYTSYYEGYTFGQENLYSLIEAYELDTYSHYVQVRSRGNYGRSYEDLKEIPTKIRWTDPIVGTEPKIITDGIPFVTMGTRSMACQYGPSKTKMKDQQSSPNIQTEEMEYSDCIERQKKKRLRRQPSKKGDCPCVIKIRHILKFPEYKANHKTDEDCTCSRTTVCHLKQNLIVRQLLEDLRIGKIVKKEHWFYLHLPIPTDHANHLREYSPAQSLRCQMRKIDCLTYLCKDKNVLKKYEEILSNLYDSFESDIKTSLANSKFKSSKSKNQIGSPRKKVQKLENKKDFLPDPQSHHVAEVIQQPTVMMPEVDHIYVNAPPNMNPCYSTNMNIHNNTMNIQNVNMLSHSVFQDITLPPNGEVNMSLKPVTTLHTL